MDTLDLVGPDDDVGDAATLLDLENSVGVATLGLASALNTTVEHDHTTIEGLASGNGLGSRQGRGAGGGGQRTTSAAGAGAGATGGLGAASAASGGGGSTTGGLGSTAVEVTNTAKAGAANSAVSLEVVGGHGVGSKSHGREGNSAEVELHFEDVKGVIYEQVMLTSRNN